MRLTCWLSVVVAAGLVLAVVIAPDDRQAESQAPSPRVTPTTDHATQAHSAKSRGQRAEAAGKVVPRPPASVAPKLIRYLENAPPAVPDPASTISRDAERVARYASRAARAQRLNERLQKRIEALQTELEHASGPKREQLQHDLHALKKNLTKRRELEYASRPQPQARDMSSTQR